MPLSVKAPLEVYLAQQKILYILNFIKVLSVCIAYVLNYTLEKHVDKSRVK